MKIGRVGTKNLKMSLRSVCGPRQRDRANWGSKLAAKRQSPIKASCNQLFRVGSIARIVTDKESTAPSRVRSFLVAGIERGR